MCSYTRDQLKRMSVLNNPQITDKGKGINFLFCHGERGGGKNITFNNLFYYLTRRGEEEGKKLRSKLIERVLRFFLGRVGGLFFINIYPLTKVYITFG